MRSSLISVGLVAAPVGCVWTSDGGFTERYVSSWEGAADSEPGSWEGEPIHIANRSGDVTVVGVPGKRNISVSARFTAGARNAADAEAAFHDVHESLAIELRESGWWVVCNEATVAHGSAVPASTGCDALVVEVPAGSEAEPLSLQASTSFGGIHASGTTVEALDLRAPFGLVADVTPVGGATIRLWGEHLVSGMCSSWLRVPADTGFESLSLEVEGAHLDHVGSDPDDPEFWLEVDVRGFADAPVLEGRPGSLQWTRITEGSLVESAVVRASLGKAILTTGEVPEPGGLGLCATLELGPEAMGWETPE